MTRSTSRWILLISLAIAAPLAACGSSTSGTVSGTTPTPAPTASAPLVTPTAAAASAQCPSGATVGSALGITVPDAVGIGVGGSSQIPSGATGLICNYNGTGDHVIVEVLMNINPSFITQFGEHFIGTVASVPGLGDQAKSFYDPLGGGKDNEGVVATKGQTLVSIAATDTPATLSQVEALVSSLL